MKVLRVHYDLTAIDGTKLRLRHWGGDGPPCLLLHGFGEGSYVWDDFAPRLTRHLSVYDVDLRGHGDSAWSADGEYKLDIIISDILQVIDYHAFSELVLIGHSLGAELAVHIAARRGAAVHKLVLVDLAPEVSAHTGIFMRSQFEEGLRSFKSRADYLDFLQVRRPLVSREHLSHIANTALRDLGTAGFRLKCDPNLKNRENGSTDGMLWTLFSRILCPVLIVRGEGSAICSAKVASKIQSSFADAKIAGVKMAGHAVMTDNPEGFKDAVTDFLMHYPAPKSVY